MKGQKRRNLLRFMVLTNKQCRSSGGKVYTRDEQMQVELEKGKDTTSGERARRGEKGKGEKYALRGSRTKG